MNFDTSPTWQNTYPTAAAGILAMRNLTNPEHHDALDRGKTNLEAELRARFAGQDRSELAALPTIQAYSAYYGRFRKTYHVLLQLESVALKGKPIPRVAALVEAMFMAELHNQLLTAGHDLAAIQGDVRLDVATGAETYTLLNGKEQAAAAGDMYIADGQALISSIVYGPDQRTRIRPETQAALFTVYAPPGIDRGLVRRHLEDIRDNVKLFAPAATVELLEVYTAG
jgi:DNA/RNA-binding domain of Phe-tRNA-synthetase-like protein